jgi:hypothetical protein
MIWDGMGYPGRGWGSYQIAKIGEITKTGKAKLGNP